MSYELTKEALVAALQEVGAGREALLEVCMDPSERAYRRLFWRDDMENYAVSKWPDLYPGSVAAYVNNEIPAFEGDYVLKVNDPTRTSAGVGARFGLIPAVKNSIELRWYKQSYLSYMQVRFRFLDGVNERACDILWHRDTGCWRYLTTGTTPLTPVPEGGEKIHDDTWNYLKLIGDFANSKYCKLITTGLEIDMSSIPMSTWSHVVDPWTNLHLVKNTDAINQPVYFDDVRIYLNEV